MHCPFCSHPETKVVDSRLMADGAQVRRRRECSGCGERFTTFECVELTFPLVIKQNGVRETFRESKLRSGIQRALEKRPIPVDTMDAAIHRILQTIRNKNDREISSRQIGEYVMAELHQLDQVAYVRFASVYRSFKDLDEFRAEIERLSASVSATVITETNP
ncbi:transcriptional regulator NrdR [Oceanobacter sp. 3_MG-2023]|uniref:transcriptional regulator NrdR n=1 Tax=Oceanobacter sp. 3_MG-2023 TaxID=3062622 RepID=UPI0027358F16|nr:transcriptional regulator NrdR [Oceanobacter sp. 3_MG-2023]MDP2505315.1 transcriptional regulator NrdR [Oceanobacter sp. 3_MG-2023]